MVQKLERMCLPRKSKSKATKFYPGDNLRDLQRSTYACVLWGGKMKVCKTPCYGIRGKLYEDVGGNWGWEGCGWAVKGRKNKQTEGWNAQDGPESCKSRWKLYWIHRNVNRVRIWKVKLGNLWCWLVTGWHSRLYWEWRKKSKLIVLTFPLFPQYTIVTKLSDDPRLTANDT